MKTLSAKVGVIVRHLQRLDALEDSALERFALFYARKNRLSRLKRKAAAIESSDREGVGTTSRTT
jgi:hypothetical protein